MKIDSPSNDKIKILSGSLLKLIAIITMLIDHFALILNAELGLSNILILTIFDRRVTLYYILRKIGRLAFPIFCFLVAEGFFYTKNPIKYAAKLGVFALISEIPFNLMLSGNIFYPNKQNVYVTLFLGVVLLFILTRGSNKIIQLLFSVLIILIAGYARIDYGIRGVLLIVLLFILRDKKNHQIVCSFPFLSGGYAAWCGIFLTLLYNNKRGFIKSPLLKYAFYVFYPAHIVILFLIKNFI